MIRLVVPYSRKDELKRKYGLRWNAAAKYWFWDRAGALPDELQELVYKPYYTPSEEIKLTIELVPNTCWFSNVRNHVSKDEWDRIRKAVFRNAQNRCQVCGGRGPQWPVECHEIFDFINETRTQKLLSLAAVCPSCHQVKHIGLAQIKGKEQEALEHICNVNGWTMSQARTYEESQIEIWRERCQYDWSVDLSFLKDHFGITVEEESAIVRANRAKDARDVISQTRHFVTNEEIMEALQTNVREEAVSEAMLEEEFGTTSGAVEGGVTFRTPREPSEVPPPIPSRTEAAIPSVTSVSPSKVTQKPAKPKSIWDRVIGFLTGKRNWPLSL
jgi:hypothetical protein